MPPLPQEPPLSWSKARHHRENPPEFIMRVYSPWVGRGLLRADIRRLDKQLYNALKTWLSRHEPPEGFNLPGLTEEDKLWTSRIATDDVDTRVFSAPHTIREAKRIVSFRSSQNDR